MKYIAWAVVIVVCFVVGKIMYAPLGPALLSKDQASGKAGDDTPTFEFGAANQKLRITIDMKSVDDSEVPEFVALRKAALVSAPGDTNVTTLDAESEVRVLKRNGSNLEIAALSGPLQGIVPIADTDFAQRVVERRIAKIVSARSEVAQNTPAVAPQPQPGPAEPEPMPEPQPEPTPPAVVQTPTPEPTPAPEPEPEPEPEPADKKLNPQQIVELMQTGIKAGEIKEFTFDKVKEWKGLEEEENIDGETYQIGVASYMADTIFGPKPVNAKALIKGGEIKKWIYEKTGMEIR